jgi:hypothetical protein
METGMEDWDRNADWSRDALERVVALLFALACLAELAACLPWLHRQQLLGILSHGEAEAWAFVMGLPPDAAVPADAPASAGNAARLAASFRALALMLCAMLARAALFALPSAVGSQARRPLNGISGIPVSRPDGPAPSAPDTS